jgi:hypothetical protein
MSGTNVFGPLSVLLTVFSLLGIPSRALADPATLVLGVPWRDQQESNIQGHGGSIVKVGSTYFWFGEDKTGENDSDALFQHVACYSSTDLAKWTFVSDVLSRQPSGDLGPNRIIERPKVIFNSNTQQFVMYMHVDTPGYGTGRLGIATSSSVCGNYTYHGSLLPLGLKSWDIGLFQDTDGTGYLLTHAGDNHLHIDKLSSDYLSVASSVAALTPNFEAPAIFKANGRYYLFGSHLTGWNSNDNVYASATSLAGPWSAWSTFAPVGSDTYNSQTTFILPVSGTQGTTYMYAGDRWNAGNLGASTFVWLPLQVNGGTVSMNDYYDSWSIDAATGTWQGTPSNPLPTALVSVQSGRCLDDPGFSTTNGTQMDIWDCNRGANQMFIYQWGTLRFMGKCLDVFADHRTPGVKVELWDCNGGGNQQWSINPDGTITAVDSSLCLDVVGNNTANGGIIDIWTCNGQTNQQWLKR